MRRDRASERCTSVVAACKSRESPAIAVDASRTLT